MLAPVFIVGVGRSGTTLLRLMLHNHPRIAIPYESHFLTKYHAKLAEYGDLSDSENARRLVRDILDEPNLKMWDHDFEADRVLGAVKEWSFPGITNAIYSDYAAKRGKERWGDKSAYLGRIDIINEVFPTAQFIHIVRDGRDVANSVMKLPWGPTDILRAADWWNEHSKLGRRMGSILGPKRYAEVRYEDLVENPEKELRRLCTFLGEEYSDEMPSYYKKSDEVIPEEKKAQHYKIDKPPDPSRCYSWKREMHQCDVLLFNQRAAQMLGEFGYERPKVEVGRVRLGLRLFKILWRRYRSYRA